MADEKMGSVAEFPLFTVLMTAADWIAVPGNPRQRDPDHRLKRAKHLHSPSPTHFQVTAAQLPDGTMIKLDGATRGLFWELNPDLAPDKVLVVVVPAGSLDAAAELRAHFNNPAAVRKWLKHG